MMDKALAEHAADVLKAVAHPLRLQIVELLRGGEMCVGDISKALGEKQSLTSQQLSLMRDRGVVVAKRRGSKVFYRLQNKNITKLLDCIYDHCRKPTGAIG